MFSRGAVFTSTRSRSQVHAHCFFDTHSGCPSEGRDKASNFVNGAKSNHNESPTTRALKKLYTAGQLLFGPPSLSSSRSTFLASGDGDDMLEDWVY